jgi:hypothetical protein
LNRRSENRGRKRLFTQGPARWGFTEWSAIATILALPLAIVSVYQNANNSASVSTTSSGPPSSSRASVTSTSPPGASLKVIDIVILNGTDWERSPQIQVTLHNTGSQRSIIKRALFRIQSLAALPVCLTAGELLISKKYDVTLPVTPPKDEAPVEKPVSQQLGPDEADRFAFSLSAPQSIETPTVYLYQLQVEFLHDTETTPLTAGNVVVALPGAPGRHGLEFWGKGEPANGKVTRSSFDAAYSHLGAYQETVRSCLDSNTSELRRMLALDGERSKELTNLPKQLG